MPVAGDNGPDPGWRSVPPSRERLTGATGRSRAGLSGGTAAAGPASRCSGRRRLAAQTRRRSTVAGRSPAARSAVLALIPGLLVGVEFVVRRGEVSTRWIGSGRSGLGDRVRRVSGASSCGRAGWFASTVAFCVLLITIGMASVLRMAPVLWPSPWGGCRRPSEDWDGRYGREAPEGRNRRALRPVATCGKSLRGGDFEPSSPAPIDGSWT